MQSVNGQSELEQYVGKSVGDMYEAAFIPGIVLAIDGPDHDRFVTSATIALRAAAPSTMLTAGIRHHVKEEEQEVFPELKRKIDREELLELGDKVAAAKKPQRRTRAAA